MMGDDSWDANLQTLEAEIEQSRNNAMALVPMLERLALGWEGLGDSVNRFDWDDDMFAKLVAPLVAPLDDTISILLAEGCNVSWAAALAHAEHLPAGLLDALTTVAVAQLSVGVQAFFASGGGIRSDSHGHMQVRKPGQDWPN